jgi:hypothetical protein
VDLEGDSKGRRKLGSMTHICSPSYSRRCRYGDQSKANPGKIVRLYLKNKLKQKGMGAWLKR